MLSSGKSVTVRIDALAFGGDAVGRDPSGRAVFVAGAAPGDLVEVALVEEKARFARGELVRVVEAGAVRREAPCPIAARCGGCPFMHVDEAAQREAKQAIVARALGRAAPDVVVRPIAYDPDGTLGWRTRARMRIDGSGAIGFSGRRSHALVPVERCLALDPRLDAALQEAARAARRAGLRAEGEIAGVVADDGRVHLALECEDERALGALEAAAGALVGVAGVVGVVARAGRREAVAGERELALASGERTSAAGFQQANARMNTRLRAAVVELLALDAAPVPPRLLELYAGDGNLTRAVAAAGPVRLLAVEGEPAAAARLRRNVAALAGVDARADDAARAARRLADAGERFDAVLLDPPRAGAADAVPHLARLGAARIVYVSCDPMTLARDVEALAKQGYAARVAQPFELMPQTSHVEVVCLLTPSAPR
jgi:23S rRNA (uracil1939-C5)-methyltransferase